MCTSQFAGMNFQTRSNTYVIYTNICDRVF
ncbi:MAG: hypothetical protein ACLRPV_07365 [Lacrimispora saccharolytica]